MLGKDTNPVDFWGGLVMVAAASVFFTCWTYYAANKLRARSNHGANLGLRLRVSASLIVPVAYPYGLLRTGNVSPLFEQAGTGITIMWVLVALSLIVMTWLTIDLGALNLHAPSSSLRCRRPGYHRC